MRLQNAGKLFFYLLLVSNFSMAVVQEKSQNQPAESGSGTIIHVTVTDRHHRSVTGLKAEDFTLTENELQQPIGSVTSDVPACMALVVDSSGSMRSKIPGVAASLLDFVRAGNPQNTFFVVNFNDQPYLDQDFTGNINLIDQGLRHTDARGGTALYDAVVASADHLGKARGCRKRVMVVVSDGVDNESRENLEQALRALEKSRGSIVYAIELEEENPSKQARARRALESMTAATGGRLFSVGAGRDSRQALLQAAAEIRSQYTISYAASTKSARAVPAPGVRVTVNGTGLPKDLHVQTSMPVPDEAAHAESARQ